MLTYLNNVQKMEINDIHELHEHSITPRRSIFDITLVVEWPELFS